MLRSDPPRLEALPLAGMGQEQTIRPGSLKSTRSTRLGCGRSVTLRAGLELMVQGLDNPQVSTLDHSGPVGGRAPEPLLQGDQGRPEGSAVPPTRENAATGSRCRSSGPTWVR